MRETLLDFFFLRYSSLGRRPRWTQGKIGQPRQHDKVKTKSWVFKGTTLEEKFITIFIDFLYERNDYLERLVKDIVSAIQATDFKSDTALMIGNSLSDPLNEPLRNKVYRGEITPSQLVALEESDLLNPLKRKELEQARKERLEQKTMAFVEQLTAIKTELFTCPACGNKECHANFRTTLFVKWQGDDPNPTILKCLKCGHQFKE